MTALTAFDVVVMLIIGIAAVAGVLRGFVTEILSLIAWVFAILAIRIFFEPASALAAEATGTESGGAILAFVLLFLVTFVGFRFLARNLGARTRTSVVGPIDRVLGLGFGALKGLIGASLLFLLITLFFDVVWGARTPKPEWLQSSKTYPLLRLSSAAIADFVEDRREGRPLVSEDPHADLLDAPGGYDREERDALGDLVDESGTPL
jgi:membrane protein required for colicin V production